MKRHVVKVSKKKPEKLIPVQVDEAHKIMIQRIGSDKEVIKTMWLHETTGKLVVVEGFQCPEGCRDMDREEVDALIRSGLLSEVFQKHKKIIPPQK